MKTKELTKCALSIAIMIVSSQISVPLTTGVPVTMQTLAVMLSGIVLGKKNGFISAAVYVLLGALGLPVFAEFSGGIHTVIGPTGGFLITFPIMSYMCGYAAEQSNSYKTLFLGAIAGALVNYAAGCLMFSVLMNASLGYAFTACVVPFLLTDALKITVAVTAGKKVRYAALLTA